MRNFLIPILLSLTFSLPAFAVTAPTPKQSVVPKPSIAGQKVVKKKKGTAVRRTPRVRKYVSPPGWIGLENVPLMGTIPEEVVASLAKNKVEYAVRLLRVETPTARSLYLLRESQRVLAYQKEKKGPASDQHEFYQNLGIAYHNLYAFLKRNDITNNSFYNSAMKFYKKALKTESVSEQMEVRLLMATLMAVGGKEKNAEKMFAKVDTSALDDSSNVYEYLASYYGAMGNVIEACFALDMAHERNPEQIRIWTAISDDFYKIENEDAFKSMLSSWSEKRKADLAKANEVKRKKAKKPLKKKQAPK